MVNKDKLEELYSLRHKYFLKPLEEALEEYIKDCVADFPRIDLVKVRAKSVDRFLEKSEKKKDGHLRYADPINQIQDQLGARIVTFYLSDVDKLSKKINDFFRPIEETKRVPDSPDKFGYEGRHFILFIPEDILDLEKKESRHIFPFFELQIKTLFQHAWSEAAHNLAYKPPVKLCPLQERKVAFTGAQAWGADNIFNDLAKALLPVSKTNGKLKTDSKIILRRKWYFWSHS